MKLPGINYQVAVGPDVSTLPLSTARAWDNATNAWVDTLQTMDEQLQQQQAAEALQNFVRDVDATEDQLKFNPTWNVQTMGEPPQAVSIATRNNLGNQPSYQTHEFAGQMYDHVAKTKMEEYTKGLSPKAARLARTKMMAHTTQRRSYVLEEQFKRKRDFAKGSMLNAINTATAGARVDNLEDTILSANQMIANGIKSGTIGMEEGEKLRVKVLDEAYYSAVLDTARRAQSDDELDELEVQTLNSPMRTENLSRALNQIDARRTVMDREEKERYQDNLRIGAAGAMRGDLKQSDIPDLLSSNALNAQGGLTLYRLLEEGKPTEKTFKDPNARNYWAGQIRRLRFGIGQEETLRERNIRLQKDINAAALGFYEDGTPYQGMRMTETDAAWALEELDKQYSKVLSHPEMKQVLADIRTHTGMDGIVDIDASSNNRRAQLAFTQAAWSYYDRMTIDADMREWFEKNKSLFDPENFRDGSDAERLKASGVPAQYFQGRKFDSREISVWLEQSNVPPEKRRVIEETLLPLAVPTMEQEMMNNAIEVESLIESQ